MERSPAAPVGSRIDAGTPKAEVLIRRCASLQSVRTLRKETRGGPFESGNQTAHESEEVRQRFRERRSSWTKRSNALGSSLAAIAMLELDPHGRSGRAASGLLF